MTWQDKLEEMGAFWRYQGDNAPHVKTSMSGKHVDAYFNSDVILSDPTLTEEIIESVLISKLQEMDVRPDWVVGYAPYSIPVAQMAARILEAKFGYSRPGLDFDISFNIQPGDTALVVADDMYGGGATLGTIAKLESMGVEVVPVVFCLANLSGNEKLDDRTIIAATSLKATKYQPDACALCEDGSEALVARDNWAKLQLRPLQ